MKFSIYRYDPDKDSQPYMQDFELTEDRIRFNETARLREAISDFLTVAVP